MTLWNKLKQLFTGKSLSTQFEEILLKDETPPIQVVETPPAPVVEAETVKEEPVAKKKTVAKPAAKTTAPAAKPTAKGKKK